MIPISVPALSELETRYVTQALASTWISSSGEFLSRFEVEFAEGVAHSQVALAVSNGTVALHLALAALGAGRGDEVIVPSLTYVATANAVKYVGADPVFADVESGSWGIDPLRLEELIGPRTVGVVAVHLYGHPADMDAIRAVASRHGLWVVEDAAEAPFATYKGRRTGDLGDVATFSFYGNKILTSGEGGAVTTSDPVLAERMRLLRGQGMDPQRRYYFPVVGYNFRLTNVAAALLCAQVERSELILRERLRVFQGYDRLFDGVRAIGRQPRMDWATISPWLYSVMVDPAHRDAIMTSLAQAGVETRPFFIPVHTLPPYRSARRGDLPVTESLSVSGLNLPTYPAMSDQDVATVAEAVLRCVV